MSEQPAAAPPFWMTALESQAALEIAAWPAVLPLLSRMRAGDGHPVLVLPGFTAGDRSTARLRQLLRRLGYRTYGWRQGANLGPTPQIVNGLQERFSSILDKEGRPISIVGWSLGGIYARSMARTAPESVRQVITLGSPIRMRAGDPSAVSGLWNSLSPLHDADVVAEMAAGNDDLLPVPTTSIYTRTDGIVHWRNCLEVRSERSENVEVFATHCGLGVNASALAVVANRLAQPEGDWRRFRPPVWLRANYPRPRYHKPQHATTG